VMTAKERLISALKGEKVDRPPFICPGGMMNMVTTEVMQRVGISWPGAHLDPPTMARLALEVSRLTGIENLGVPFCMTVEAEAMGARVAMGTRETEPRVVDYPLSDVAEWAHLHEIRPGAGRIGIVTEAVGILAGSGTDLPIIANLTGPISLATSLIEPMVFFKAMGKQPQVVHKFLSFVTDNLVTFGRILLQAGAHVLTIADPSGTGEILGPRRFAEFALPYLNRILEELGDLCEATIVHICGRLRSIYREINQLKTGAVSIDSSTSVAGIKDALDHKVVVGNVSTYLLQKGRPERVRAAALTCLAQGAAVLSPACGISPNTPLANLQAMARAAGEFNFLEQAGCSHG